MTVQKVLVLFAITAALVVVDWILQVFAVDSQAMRWVYLLANLPFGIVYLWTEAQHTAGQYLFFGRLVAENTINIVQMAAIYAQALVYFAIWLHFEEQQSFIADTTPLPRGLDRLLLNPLLAVTGLTLLTLILACGGMELLLRLPDLNGQTPIPVTGSLRIALDFGRLMATLWLLASLSALLLFHRRGAPRSRR